MCALRVIMIGFTNRGLCVHIADATDVYSFTIHTFAVIRNSLINPVLAFVHIVYEGGVCFFPQLLQDTVCVLRGPKKPAETDYNGGGHLGNWYTGFFSYRFHRIERVDIFIWIYNERLSSADPFQSF